jgi:hypothetical protein
MNPPEPYSLYQEETSNETWPHRAIVVGVPDSGLFVHVELEDKE